jgi:hypothetical protein
VQQWLPGILDNMAKFQLKTFLIRKVKLGNVLATRDYDHGRGFFIATNPDIIESMTIDKAVSSYASDNKIELDAADRYMERDGILPLNTPILQVEVKNFKLYSTDYTMDDQCDNIRIRGYFDISIGIMIDLEHSIPSIIGYSIEDIHPHNGTLRYVGNDIYPDFIGHIRQHNLIPTEEINEFMKTY